MNTSLGSRGATRLVLFGLGVSLCGCGSHPTAPSSADALASRGAVLQINVAGDRSVLLPGSSLKLEAVILDNAGLVLGNRTQESAWNSSRFDVAQVSAGGLLTAIGAGTAQISASFGNLTGTTLVRVGDRSGAASGHIDAQTAADIIAYNQEVTAFASWRRPGRISRWELPVSIYVEPAGDRGKVEAAMRAWQDLTGVTYRLIDEDAGPRIRVRSITAITNPGSASASYDDFNLDNSPRLCTIGIPSVWAAPVWVYQHELGHTLGALSHIPDSLMAQTGSHDLTGREVRFFIALYSLPHGAHVNPDGSWTVE